MRHAMHSYWPSQISKNVVVYHICWYILPLFVQTVKKCLIMISPKHGITAALEGTVIGIMYVGELEIHTVLTYQYVTYSARLGPFLIALYVAFTA